MAFADAARRFLFRPTVRSLGARWAGAFVFLVSGLIHEAVISLPVRGGWGGPTLYFLLQGVGIMIEKSVAGHRLGIGAGLRGWLWMAIWILNVRPNLTSTWHRVGYHLTNIVFGSLPMLYAWLALR